MIVTDRTIGQTQNAGRTNFTVTVYFSFLVLYFFLSFSLLVFFSSSLLLCFPIWSSSLLSYLVFFTSLISSYLLLLLSHLLIHIHNLTCSYSYLCRGIMREVKEPDNKPKLLEIFKHFKPVFRFFFLEKFHDPSVWMNNRLKYAHSVAVTSIVGYILGEFELVKMLWFFILRIQFFIFFNFIFHFLFLIFNFLYFLEKLNF